MGAAQLMLVVVGGCAIHTDHDRGGGGCAINTGHRDGGGGGCTINMLVETQRWGFHRCHQ